LWASVTLALLALSEIPNIWVKRAAEREDLPAVRRGLIVMSLIVLPIFATRAFEFDHLNVGWDRNAYGSITWALLFMHTVHLITDWVDTLVLTVLMHTRHAAKGRRFVDTSENALYWHFIALSWVLVYGVIYWVPRLHG
jgi:cytochrome c oxidase subunit 3